VNLQYPHLCAYHAAHQTPLCNKRYGALHHLRHLLHTAHTAHTAQFEPQPTSLCFPLFHSSTDWRTPQQGTAFLRSALHCIRACTAAIQAGLSYINQARLSQQSGLIHDVCMSTLEDAYLLGAGAELDRSARTLSHTQGHMHTHTHTHTHRVSGSPRQSPSASRLRSSPRAPTS